MPQRKKSTPKRPAKKTAVANRSTKVRPVRKTTAARQPRAARPAAKSRSRGKPAARTAVQATRRRRPTTAARYLAKINDLRRDCVAALGRIVKHVELPDPRKLISPRARKAHAARLARLKAAGKRELGELVRLASRLHEAAARPRRARKSTPK